MLQRSTSAVPVGSIQKCEGGGVREQFPYRVFRNAGSEVMIELMYQGCALFGLSRLVCQNLQTKPFEIRDTFRIRAGLYLVG